MARRLILDTGILVASERASLALPVTHSEDAVAVAAVTIAEYQAGVALATGERRHARQEFLQAWLDDVTVLDYDLEVALAHGDLLAHVRTTGRPRGAHDLTIAATAVATGRTLVTTDRRARFEDLPGVDCQVIG